MTRPPSAASRPSPALALVAVPLAGCVSNAPARAAADRIAVDVERDGVHAVRDPGAGRHDHLRGEEHRRRGHRVLPARRGRRCGSSARWRTSGPGVTRDLVVQAEPGAYFTACKPGMIGDGIRAAFTVTDSARLDRPPRATRPQQLAAAEQAYVAYVQRPRRRARRRHPGVRRRVHRGRRRQGPRAVRARPACTGSASSPSPSRSATSTRCSTCARPTSPRARRGAAGTASRRTCGRRRPTRTAASAYVPLTAARARGRGQGLVTVHPAARRQGQRRRLHVRRVPDRERRQGAARRGRDGQGHGRGGDLVAHRPVGLPGQRRRRAGGVRGAARPSPQATDAELVETLEQRFDALNALLAKHGSIEAGFKSYDQLTERRGPGAGGRGRRR